MQIVIIGSGVAGVSFAKKYRALSADDNDCMAATALWQSRAELPGFYYKS